MSQFFDPGGWFNPRSPCQLRRDIQVPDKGGSRRCTRSTRRKTHRICEDKGHSDRTVTLQGLLAVPEADM